MDDSVERMVILPYFPTDQIVLADDGINLTGATALAYEGFLVDNLRPAFPHLFPGAVVQQVVDAGLQATVPPPGPSTSTQITQSAPLPSASFDSFNFPEDYSTPAHGGLPLLVPKSGVKIC